MMSTSNNGRPVPSRSDIWLFDPDPVRGREQGNVRPCVIVSNDSFNRLDRGLVVIVPMTGTQRDFQLYPYHVAIESEQSGLPQLSVAMCEQVRAISVDRLLGRGPRGQIDEALMEQIESKIRILLDLQAARIIERLTVSREPTLPLSRSRRVVHLVVLRSSALAKSRSR